MLRLLHTIREGLRRTDGIAAVEFAFIAPILIVMLLVGADIGRYLSATERADDVASTIGQMMSQNTSGTVNDTDLQFFRDSAMVTFPQVLADAQQNGNSWLQNISISIASIKFTTIGINCGTLCIYLPKVMWTGGSSPRACSLIISATADASVPDPTTLPVDLFQSGTVIVVDVVYTFRPTISMPFLNNMTIKRSYYITPRFVPQINYTPSAATPYATNCPLI